MLSKDKILKEDLKRHIDGMSHMQLAYTWRHAPPDSELLRGAAGEYLRRRLVVAGGITPAVSKQIGW